MRCEAEDSMWWHVKPRALRDDMWSCSKSLHLERHNNNCWAVTLGDCSSHLITVCFLWVLSWRDNASEIVPTLVLGIIPTSEINVKKYFIFAVHNYEDDALDLCPFLPSCRHMSSVAGIYKQQVLVAFITGLQECSCQTSWNVSTRMFFGTEH